MAASARPSLVADEDEFEEAVVAGWISEPEAQQARLTTTSLRTRLIDGDVLLDTEGFVRLRKAVRRGFQL